MEEHPCGRDDCDTIDGQMHNTGWDMECLTCQKEWRVTFPGGTAEAHFTPIIRQWIDIVDDDSRIIGKIRWDLIRTHDPNECQAFNVLLPHPSEQRVMSYAPTYEEAATYSQPVVTFYWLWRYTPPTSNTAHKRHRVSVLKTKGMPEEAWGSKYIQDLRPKEGDGA
jgi:hypothetical protein